MRVGLLVHGAHTPPFVFTLCTEHFHRFLNGRPAGTYWTEALPSPRPPHS